MLESSMMKNLMRRIEAAAAAESARRVVGVSIWLGALSQMSAAHFAAHFEEAARGTIADGARIDVAISDDIGHVNAQDVLLHGIEVDT